MTPPPPRLRLRRHPRLQPRSHHRRGDRERAGAELARLRAARGRRRLDGRHARRPPPPSPTRGSGWCRRRTTSARPARATSAPREARGDWIAFQDSDDEWLPRKLEKQMARLLAPGRRLRRRLLRPADPRLARRGARRAAAAALRPDAGARRRRRRHPRPAADRNLISTQTLVVRRDRFAALGGFDPETTPIEDWDFVIRLAGDGADRLRRRAAGAAALLAELDHPRPRPRAGLDRARAREERRRLRPAPAALRRAMLPDRRRPPAAPATSPPPAPGSPAPAAPTRPRRSSGR